MSEERERRAPVKPRRYDGPEQRCQWCGQAMPRSRADRQFCSDNHRMAFRRWKERLYDLTRRTMADIKEISEYSAFISFVDPRQQISAISAHLERYRNVTENRVNKAIGEAESDH